MNKEFIDKNTIFSTITGSHAYGTNNEDSDLDIRGIAILNDLGYYFGFMKNFEQYEGNKEEDTVIYDIRKAFKLMADCNPNMLDLLFTDEQFWKKTSKYWENIVAHRDEFLSKSVKFRYLGYSFAQLKRIRTARGWLLNPPAKKPERADYGLPDKSLLSKDDLGAFQWVLANLLRDSVSYLNFSDATKLELEEANWIGLVQQKGIPENSFEQIQNITGASDIWMEIMKREQAYLNAKRQFDSYTQWKNGRNKNRAVLEEKFGYDTKHASHLVRLCRMGEEILSEGKVLVFRPDREELKAIRNGSWTYDQVESYANDMEQKIASLAEKSKLPKEPNKAALDKLCIETIELYLKENG